MNERIKELAEKATTYIEPTSTSGEGWIFNKEKFTELIYKDIITVVAAQALLNESALDVFKNLKRIYEGVEE